MTNSVNTIIKDEKCFRCGMCYSVCNLSAISVKPNEKTGFYSIDVNEDLCVNCGKCKSICPADTDARINPKSVGKYQRLLLAHSNNSSVRTMATSGGVVNSIVRYIVEKDIVDLAIVVKENINAEFECEAIVVDKSNVDKLSVDARSFASRYVQFPTLSALKDIQNKNIAVVGVPCQINALSKFDKSNNIFKIGIACSGATSFLATKAIKKAYANDDFHIFYRGNGWCGYNSLVNGDKIIEKKHTQSDFEKIYTSQIFRQTSCRNCYDHFAENADISFFDFWNKDEMENETIGNSATIIRSERANELFNRAVEDNYISIKSEISEADALQSQGNPLFYKSSKPYGKFPVNFYFAMIDFIRKTALYKFIPVKCYKYFVKLLSKLIYRVKGK